MTKPFILIAASLTIVSSYITDAEAKRTYPGLQPSSYNSAIGCTSCHSSSNANEQNVTQPYGRLFSRYSDDDRGGSIASAYTTIEPFDVDGDGFSNLQEIMGRSSFNSKSSTPILSATNRKTKGVVTVQPLVNETVSALVQSSTSPTSLTLATGEKNIGGVVDMKFTNLTSGKATPTLIFSSGGVQTGGKVYVVSAKNVAGAALTGTVNANGSITLPAIVDEGAYDSYNKADYIATAKARTPTFTATTIFDKYANVSPDAKISPTAIIDPYAIIEPYAIVDNRATVKANIAVYSYAYVGPNVVVSANVDPYVSVSANVTTLASMPTFTGTIQTKVAVVTKTPTIPSGFGGGEDGDESTSSSESAGGLHCMTSGLGTYTLMFFGLFITGLLVRRKHG